MSACYLCNSTRVEQIHPRGRDSENTQVLQCKDCSLVFLSDMAGKSPEFYAASGMYDFQMPSRELLIREEERDTDRRFEFLSPLVRGKTYLDFGCGTGSVAREVTAVAREVSIVEPNKNHREALLREGGMVTYSSHSEIREPIDVISLFHVLEHLQDPIAILAELKGKLSTGGKLAIEVPNSNDALLSIYDSAPFRDFTFWSCHLFVFNTRTLSDVIARAGLKVDRIEQVQRYPLSNHLYWLAKGLPGGHDKWSFLDSEALDRDYAARLASQSACDTLMAVCSHPGQ